MIRFLKILSERPSGAPTAWRISTALGLCLLAALLWTDLTYRTGNRLYDQFAVWMGLDPSSDVVVIAMDARSRERLGPWPVSRDNYTRLLQRLNTSASPPRAVGFDLLFSDPRAEDEALASQMAQGLPVVLPQTLQPPTPQPGLSAVQGPADTWRLPVPRLADAAASMGHIHVRFDDDGVIRGVEPYIQQRPHFSLAILQAGRQAATGVSPDEDYLRFRMVDPRSNFKSIPFVDAIDPNFALPDLGGKWVLVGVTDPALGDQHATIYSGAAAAGTPGVYLIASMLNAGLQQRWIRLAPPAWVFAGCAVVLLLLQGAFYRLPPRHSAGWALATGATLLVLSYTLLAWLNWWVNVVPALLMTLLLWLFWAGYSLEGAVDFMRRKSRELGPSTVPLSDRQGTRTGSVVERYAGQLDRAIDRQGEQLALLDQVLRHIPDAVAVLDDHDRVLHLNQALRELVGPGSQSTGWYIQDLLGQLHLSFAGWADLQAFVAEQPQTVFELPYPTGNRFVYISAASVDKPDMASLRLLTLTDVTELRRSQAQRDQALGFLSHDMRTPVASILAVTQQLTRALHDSPPQLQMVSRVSGHAEQLMRLMDGFLIESRAHSQGLQLSERLVDDLMEDAVAQAQDLARLRGMPLVVMPSDTFFFVQVASQLMVRALLNVLMNAIKYGEPGTPIQLSTRQTGSAEQAMVAIEVSNQIAANPDNVDKDMLTQGFGLGLDLVQTVLRRHEGTALLDIPAQGQARVVLTLPCIAEQDA